MNAEKTRNILILTSIGILGLTILLPNKTLTAVLLGMFVLAAAVIYYANIRQLKPLSQAETTPLSARIVTIFLLVLVAAIIAFAVLAKKGSISATESLGKWIMTIIFSCMINLIGFVAVKLPYKASMGLRLPWTLSDSDTWHIAHRILSEMSVPMGILCFAALPVYGRVEVWILCILFAWLLVPAMVSHTYILKKWKGKV